MTLRVGMVCPYSLTVPGGVQMQVLGLARALRATGVRRAGAGTVRRPAARCRRHPARQQHPHRRQRIHGAARPGPARRSCAPCGPSATRTSTCSTCTSRSSRVSRRPRCSSAGRRCSPPSTPPATAPATGTSGRWLRWIANHIDLRCAVSSDAAALAGRYLGGDYHPVFNGIEVAPFATAEPSRSACAATRAVTLPPFRRCSKPACATCRSCRPSLPWPRRRLPALRARQWTRWRLPRLAMPRRRSAPTRRCCRQ